MTPSRCISVFLPLAPKPLCLRHNRGLEELHTRPGGTSGHHQVLCVCASSSTISTQGLHNPGSCFPGVATDTGQVSPCSKGSSHSTTAPVRIWAMLHIPNTATVLPRSPSHGLPPSHGKSGIPWATPHLLWGCPRTNHLSKVTVTVVLLFPGALETARPQSRSPRGQVWWTQQER